MPTNMNGQRLISADRKPRKPNFGLNRYGKNGHATTILAAVVHFLYDGLRLKTVQHAMQPTAANIIELNGIRK
jgi:hypothetical protein